MKQYVVQVTGPRFDRRKQLFVSLNPTRILVLGGLNTKNLNRF